MAKLYKWTYVFLNNFFRKILMIAFIHIKVINKINNMNIKYQIILKNNKNGVKLFNSINEIKKIYNLKDIKTINDIIIPDNKNILTGIKNNRGKQFLNRKNKLNRVVSI